MKMLPAFYTCTFVCVSKTTLQKKSLNNRIEQCTSPKELRKQGKHSLIQADSCLPDARE